MAVTPHELVLEAKAQIQEIECSEARELLGKALVVDVREYEEYAAGHLPGAINIPRGVLEFTIGNQPGAGDRQAALLVYCKTGGRSALATVQLQRLGYTNLRSLAGGFERWASQQLPVDRPAPVSYE